MSDISLPLLNRNLKVLLFSRILFLTMFVQPIIILFYETKGLTFVEFLNCIIITSLTIVCSEIPFGYLTDRWQRRYTYIIGAILITVGNVWMYFAQGFDQIIYVFILEGLSFSLLRGAFGALLYDTLLNLKRESEHNALLGSINSWGHTATAVSAMASGVLFYIHVDLPVLIQIVVGFSLIFTAYMVYEPKRKKIKEKGVQLHKLWDILVHTFFTHKDLVWVILFGAILCAATSKAIWIIQPALDKMNVSVIVIGFAGAAIEFVMGFASKNAAKLINKFGMKGVCILSCFFTCIGYVAASFSESIMVLLPLFLVVFAYGVVKIPIQTMINERVSSDVRATTMAINSAAIGIIYSAVNYMFAFVMLKSDMKIALIVTAVLVAVITFISIVRISYKTEIH